MTDRLVIAGLGYAGAAVAVAAREAGMDVVATARDPATRRVPAGVALVAFDAAQAAIAAATHILVTAAPGEGGDPVLARYRAAIGAAERLRWIGYCSTTGVYGDRQGGAVDEDSAAAPGSDRTRRRVAAERDWASFGDRCAVDIIRLAGIYGPGRSAFDDLRAGAARRIDRPGHKFSRIHVTDIALGVMAAMAAATSGVRVLNFADDVPAPSAEVIAHAASLLGIAPPPLVSFEAAKQTMTPMALSFWRENRVVLNRKTKTALGISWRYPSYREGLAAILAGAGS
ncbi:Rossmann-fold NAD(P)-binding domain-containing protein [Acidiphilium iwatense]|uniref:SDR family NAD(P)-dependent oxidoreductase n=1 Tax=Acidiphilium iwatense TaxID=768198 RepID=A0ABS9DYD6_9PROT|nr:SDR family NAD(P)-dependent oxidoreductase [Acidiphilium iwatense]MCF3947165.1 SDR family NAD(P)-dependent oxidoreductase [Acidiphilium iwatense]